jgi:hypothetical protein
MFFVSYERAETVASRTNDWLINQLAAGTAVHILVPARGNDRGVLLEAYLR